MAKEVNEEAPFCPMKNGMTGIDYPGKYMHTPNPNAPGPTNSVAKNVDHAKVMNQVLTGK